MTGHPARSAPRVLFAALTAAGALTLVGPSAFAAATLSRLDFRPVAAEGSARAAWVNPSGIGSGGEQLLLVEVSGVEDAAGDFDIQELASFTLAASTGRTAYAFLRELDDVPGVADWILIAANRVERRNGMQVGSAIELRGGEGRTLDGTVSLSMPLGAGLRAAMVLEDVFAADVDGAAGSRHWRGGLAFLPVGGTAYFSWDYDRLEKNDRGEQWFGVGLERGKGLLFRAARSDGGDWSVRVGLEIGTARVSGILVDPDDAPRAAGAAMEFVGGPIVR